MTESQMHLSIAKFYWFLNLIRLFAYVLTIERYMIVLLMRAVIYLTQLKCFVGEVLVNIIVL